MVTATTLHLDILPDRFAVARLDQPSGIPEWSRGGGFLSISWTPGETSIVCEESRVPNHVTAQRGLRCLRVRGTVDFNVVGVLQSVVEPLARAEVSIFALSTYDTDYILISSSQLEAARAALVAVGHTLGESRADQ